VCSSDLSFGENPGALRTGNPPQYNINGSTIEFFGIEGNVAKAHGPRRDILFINEANRKVTYDVYDQLNTRTHDCTFVDFNPDQEFWIHDKVMPNFPHVFIKSNFIDNPYLPENELKNILMKKDKVGFENWWKVYGLGELGKLEGAVFSNWHYGPFDYSLPAGYGLDFGFNAPDALVKVAIDVKRKKMYWEEKIYKEGNSADQLRQMVAVHCNRNDVITADCADARMINELKKFFNIHPVNKNKWTVPEALKMMQDYEHIITEESYNVGKEFSNYIWNDKKAGVPINAFNHAIDAGRYRFQETMRGGGYQTWYA
jgi:phage terminase large subunit